MTTKQTIIELRETDSKSVNHAVGHYECDLAQPLTLQPGSEISLKGVFINSEGNNGRITVRADAPDNPLPILNSQRTFTISFVHYYLNASNPNGFTDMSISPVPSTESSDNSGAKYFDGRHYILTNSIPQGNQGDLVFVETIKFKMGGDIDKHYRSIYGGNGEPDMFLFAFDYIDASGSTQQIVFEPTRDQLQSLGFTWGKKHGHGGTMTMDAEFMRNQGCNFPFICKAGSFVPSVSIFDNPDGSGETARGTGAKLIKGYGLEFIGDNTTPAPDQLTLEPRIYTKSFKIPSGSYSPNALARVMTNAITQIQEGSDLIQNGAGGVADNILLTSVKQLYANGLSKDPNNNFAPDPVAERRNKNPVFLSEFDARMLTFGSAPDIEPEKNVLIGTANFNIQFLPDEGAEGSFAIGGLHNSLFSLLTPATGNQTQGGIDNTQVVRHVKSTQIVNDEFGVNPEFYAGKQTGILLTSLTPTEIWFDQMGFDTSVLVNFTTKTNSEVGGRTTKIPATTFSTDLIRTGVNATSDIIGTAVIANQAAGFYDVAPEPVRVIKRADAPDPTDELSQLAFLFREIQVSNSALLNAKNPFNGVVGGQLNAGYYLVEISGSAINATKIGGSTYSKTIMGIVSRYYNLNSFTSSLDGEGSFTYIHPTDAEPIMMNSFRVRILEPNGVLTQSIKPQTTVFLNVITPE